MTLWPNGTRIKPPTFDDYGWRTHPITGLLTFHYGWDTGGFDINCAVQKGTVTYAGYNGGAGNQINVDHGANGFRSVYKHNASFLVGVNSVVAEGQGVGVQGTTGDSTGKHLHLEIVLSFSGETIDPVPFLGAAVASLPTSPFPGTPGAPAPLIGNEDPMTDLMYYITAAAPASGQLPALVAGDFCYQECVGAPIFTLPLATADDWEFGAFRAVHPGGAYYEITGVQMHKLMTLRGRTDKPTGNFAAEIDVGDITIPPITIPPIEIPPAQSDPAVLALLQKVVDGLAALPAEIDRYADGKKQST